MRFRVTKGSAFAFECSSCGSDGAQHKELQALVTRIDDLEALDIRDVNIVKRLDLADVDRMIALAPQHPPQCVVRPASEEHTQAFEEFTTYLRQRQRAGVATLQSGFLLLLTPIRGWSGYLRCLVVKTSNDTEIDVASVASYSSARSEEGVVQTTSRSSHETEKSTTRAASPPRKRLKPAPRDPGLSSATATVPSRLELVRASESRLTRLAHLFVCINWLCQRADEDGDVSRVLSPRTRDARFAQLRLEYRAFNAHRYQVLQLWIAR